jgi:nucleotide-binding universal stress UspA family protein
MLGWNRICCAVDFEPPSQLAMAQAADLAKELGAELTLVHVEPPPVEVVGEWLAPERVPAQPTTQHAEETLARWRSDAEGRAARPVRSHLCSGQPAAEILRCVREERSDLLVVGTHGRGGVPRLLLGSVAERVARQAGCPVLVVHDHEGVHHQEAKAVEEEVSQYR